ARRNRRLAGLTVLASVVAVVSSAVLGLDFANSQVSAVQLSVGPEFPTTVTVGQTGLAADLRIVNNSSGADATVPVTLTDIMMVPSCSNANTDCVGGTADPNAFRLSTTGTGRAGTGCAGRVFNIVVVDAATGR